MNSSKFPFLTARITECTHVAVYRRNDSSYTWVLLDEDEVEIASGSAASIKDAFEQARGV